jgi:hypothetical protein
MYMLSQSKQLLTDLHQSAFFQFTKSVFKAQPSIAVMWVVTALFMLITLVLIVTILISRYTTTRLENRNKHLRKRFELLFTAYLFIEDTAFTSKVVNHFNTHYFKRKATRRVLMEELLCFHKDMAGSVHDKLRELYIVCGLREDSYKKLASKNVYVKAKGIEELRQMEIREALPLITSFASHKNALIKSQVQLSVISMAENDKFIFFNEEDQTIPDWQLLNYHALIHNLDKSTLPNFCTWLNSGNSNVVRFSIRMIRLLNQADACPALLNLLQHESPLIRIEVIEALTELQYLNAIHLFQSLYNREVKEVKISIIHALEQLGDEKAGAFLLNQFPQTDDYELNMALSRACYKLSGYLLAHTSKLPYSLTPYASHIKDLSL